MSFKASKIRSVRAIKPGEGKPIVPNVGVMQWYIKQLNPYVVSMVDDYQKTLLNELNAPQTVEFFAMDEARVMDASVAGAFASLFNALNRKWTKVFDRLSKTIAPEFVGKTKTAADSSVDFSLSAAGIVEPRKTFDKHIRNTVDGYTHYNETLITEINQKAHSQIYGSVMASLTSTNPEEQGQAGIIAALKKVGIETKERVELIARDQTSKLYGALAVDRMSENGVQYFRWLHVMGSNAKNKGKIAWRQSHEALDGEVFRTDDPDLWKLGKYFSKTGDIGIPGHAINCHCRMIPIVIPSAQDLESIEARYGKKAREDFEMAA